MISPELLRRFPFFGFMTESELKSVAMISEEEKVEKGGILVEANQPADSLFFLIEGTVSLHFVVTSENDPYYSKEYHISDINPGEIFGLSALIEPYIYKARVRVDKKGRLIRINAVALRALCGLDCKLSNGLMTAAAKAAFERLESTRVQLISLKE